MNRGNAAVTYDIADTVNLQYRSEGYAIYKVRAAINHIGCERAENKSFLVFGEYTFFLLLRSMTKKQDYSIKAIRCPFIKTVPISEKLAAFESSSNLQVSLGGPPECALEEGDAPPANKSAPYRITLSFRVEFRDQVEICEAGDDKNAFASEAPAAQEGAMPSDSGTVKVWRVDSSQNHTIEQLLGIDRDTLKQFNRDHTQE